MKLRTVFSQSGGPNSYQRAANVSASSLVTAFSSGGGNTSVSISANRTTGIAPAGFVFEASVTSTETGMDIPVLDADIVWSFDDAGNYSRLTSAMPWGLSKNVAYGHVAAHTFDTAGTYTVTCTVFDGVNTVSDTTVITVSSFASLYPTSTHTIGSDVGDDYATFAAAYAAHGSDTRQRYTFRRGETFTGAILINTAVSTFQIGAHGAGADPVLDMSASGATALRFDDVIGATEISISDIEILGEYDPTATSQTSAPSGDGIEFNATGTQGSDPASNFGLSPKTIHNVKMSNIGATGVALDANKNVVVSDTEIIGWYDYGLQAGDSGYVGLCGTTIRQPLGTYNGQSKAVSPYWPDHGPIRWSRAWGPICLNSCYLVSRNDWSSSTTSRTMQPTIRWNSGGNVDQKLNVDRLLSEGGLLQVGNDTGSSTKTNAYALLDRVHHVTADHRAVKLIHGGTTLRNVIFACPNTPSGVSTGLRADGLPQFSTDAWDSGLTDATARRVEVYSSAVVDLRNDTNAQNRDQTSGARDFANFDAANIPVTDKYVGNNIGYAPNRTVAAGETSFNPVSTSNGWTPSYDGERWEGAAVDTTRNFGAEVTMTCEPLTGSAAIGGAAGKVSLRDFNGNLRATVLAGLTRSTPSTGPYEPNLES